ncbi:MAG: DUF5679 domain-containing protein [Dehalococcoidia bacterium]|nr:DUF5679 domain-containing protein [Dehalococcoidia bacterium]
MVRKSIRTSQGEALGFRDAAGVRFMRNMEKGAQARCAKCKKTVTVAGPKATLLKGERPAIAGECPDCGTIIYRIVKL